MSRKAIIWLAFGLGLGIGLLAAKLGADAIKGAQASGRVARTVSVVRAAQDIDAYQEILTEQVEVVETNDNLLAPEHDRIANARDVVGRVAAKAVPRGSPVLRSMLAPRGTRPRGVDRLSADLRSLLGNGAAALGDVDGNGYVDLVDYEWFEICFSYSGPNVTPLIPGCLDIFDFDTDGDVDLADFGAFERAKGHLPMPLRDTLGNVITIDSTNPYSPRQTCGTVGCHYIEDIANGEWFQQGRTDLAGNVDMHDDYFGDGRYWIKSAGRYGKWGQSFQFMLAAKDNTHASQIDQTTFAWIRDCSGCHSGGGQGEFDRDGQLLYNEVTGQFGYESLGETPEDVEFDGDYCVLDPSTGTVSPGAWNVTGLSEPDCLLCHRDNRPTVGGVDMVMGWRRGILAAGTSLVDDQGDPVPAYAAAATAGQGWFAGGVIATAPVPPQHDGSLTPADVALLEGWDSSFQMRAPRSTLQIDYSVGVANGSLLVNENNEVLLAPNSVALRTRDRACVSCHPLAVVAGEVWFDDRDVMYAGFNNLRDDDPTNDIPPERSTACTECHPTALDHNAAKGNSFQLQYRNELDYENFRSCRECHLTVLPNGDPNEDKHPDAPDVPGDDPIHAIGFYEGDNGPMRIMSCQACHIPYALTAGLLFRDITMPGSIGWTSQYLSADPLDPSDEDKSRWYPPLRWKVDSDGVERLFPASVWINIYFGDWDQNGSPEDLSDDVIAPIYTWRVAQVVGDVPQPFDDDGDGRPELNHPKEIYMYLQALKQNDSNGVAVATNPVLVKGHQVWYEDITQPGGVGSFEHEGTGIPITSYPYIWGMDHNVLAKEESWGSGDPPDSCNACHMGEGQSPVFDRKVLIDPLDEFGEPIYKTVRELTGVDPYHSYIPLKDTLGNLLTVDSTAPYSGRQTCGGVGCHDIDRISNGFKFQQGRTDTEGNIIVRDDYFEDGRWWQKSPSRYGHFSSSSTWHQLSAKDNANESEVNVTTFGWIGGCGGCHIGGGPGEFDRDGMRLWDAGTGKFGYELLGKTPEEVIYDGDYAYQPDTSDGVLTPARWDVTGLSEPDCLVCHTPDPEWNDGQNVNRRTWRSGTLKAFTNLVDDMGETVPAFAAAGPAGQGWFSNIEIQGGVASRLQLDYSVGVARGSLVTDPDGTVVLSSSALDFPPRDNACWACHGPIGFRESRGTTWFDDRFVHYRKFNNLTDEDPSNDVSPARSAVCVVCHPGNPEHNIAKGHSLSKHFRDDLDYVNMLTCRDCHLTVFPNGEPNPLKHPEAPDVPGDLEIHQIGFYEGEKGPMQALSCQLCHMPYPAVNPARAFGDATLTGGRVKHMTDEFYSADPLDPSNPDKSRWYPGVASKEDVDGVVRLFPVHWWFHLYWADWDQNGTPDDLTDDAVVPIPMWKLKQVTGGQPLPGITDDTGDGSLEINRPEEMLIYMQALKGDDSYGRQIAANPVYVKTRRMWYEDSEAPGGVSFLEPEGTGMAIDPWESDIYGLDHNILPAVEAWGAGGDCSVCHRDDGLSPVFDRLILVDPWGPDGQPVYERVRDLVEVDTSSYHDNIILKDSLGNPLTIDSTAPYSGRQTCGGIGCHDVNHISNGAWFQDGRTDVNGVFDMEDDYYGDGRFWIKSAGRYGKWGQSFQYLLAAKENANASQIDQTTFAWVRDCSGCHPGAGPGEYDRNEQLLYNEQTGKFGYEALGLGPEDVELDGDYSVLDYSTGSVSPAAWDVTGLSGPDCLKCHRTQRTVIDGVDMNLVWRKDVLAAGSSLTNTQGDPVPAFAAAGTAGQGWFSTPGRAGGPDPSRFDGSQSAADVLFLEMGHPEAAASRAITTLDIDYSVGVADGSLVADAEEVVSITEDSVTWPPKDLACWGCHPYGTIAGTVWFDDRDIHYRKFNNLNDVDPANDIPEDESRVCVVCHPGTVDHEIGKGNSPQLQYRNELDWGNGFRTCRNCHLTQLPDGDPNPLKHPDAPDVPGDDEAHAIDGMMDNLSCQACHIPYPLTSSVLFRDITVPGSVGTSGQYYSADPLEPTDPDKSRWYPGFVKKEDVDGVERWFPANIWITIYFGDWDQNGTPEDLTDDVISPIYTWRLAQAVGSPTEPLPIVTDDDGDGRKEINRPEELLAYFEALQGNDANGQQIAANPVLVRGKRFWYADPQGPEGVGSFEHEGTGIAVEKWYPYLWGLDHNVLVAEESWGYDDFLDPEDGCNHCHRYDGRSPVFDRKILVDPCDPDGQAIYQTVREMTELNPP